MVRRNLVDTRCSRWARALSLEFISAPRSASADSLHKSAAYIDSGPHDMKLFLLLAAALAAIVAVQAVPHVEDYNVRSNNDQSVTAVSGPLAGVGCSIKVLGRGAALVAEYTVKCFVTSVPSGPLFFLFFPFCVASSVLDIISITSEDLQKCATSLLF